MKILKLLSLFLLLGTLFSCNDRSAQTKEIPVEAVERLKDHGQECIVVTYDKNPNSQKWDKLAVFDKNKNFKYTLDLTQIPTSGLIILTLASLVGGMIVGVSLKD